MAHERAGWQNRWLFLSIVSLISLLGVVLPFALTEQAASLAVWITPVFLDYSLPEKQALQHRPVPFPKVAIPAEIDFCIGSKAERLDLLATVQQPNKTLYLLAAYNDFVSTNSLIPLNVQDELIALHHQGTQQWCERLMPQLGENLKPLNAFMSSQTALNLELQRYRHWMAQAGGKAKFQQCLIRQIQEERDSYQLSNEQVKALHQLGIHFPDNYRSLTSTTFSSGACQSCRPS